MFLLKICRSPGRGGYFSVSLVSGLVCNSKLLCDVQSLSLTSGTALPHGPPRQEWSRDLLWQTCGQQQGVSLLSGSFRNQVTAVNSFPSAPRQCAREKVLQRGTKQPLTNGWLATGGLWGNGLRTYLQGSPKSATTAGNLNLRVFVANSTLAFTS